MVHHYGLELRHEADELSQGRAVTIFRNAMTKGKGTAIFEAQKVHGHRNRGAGWGKSHKYFMLAHDLDEMKPP